jgi:hypothetical protein
MKCTNCQTLAAFAESLANELAGLREKLAEQNAYQSLAIWLEGDYPHRSAAIDQPEPLRSRWKCELFGRSRKGDFWGEGPTIAGAIAAALGADWGTPDLTPGPTTDQIAAEANAAGDRILARQRAEERPSAGLFPDAGGPE